MGNSPPFIAEKEKINQREILYSEKQSINILYRPQVHVAEETFQDS